MPSKFFRLHAPSLGIFKDAAITDQDWDDHHSWRRHLPEPLIFLTVAIHLLPILLWVLIVSTAVGLYYELGQLKSNFPQAVSDGYVEPFVLTSFALSLLLVFRTNSSYDRWWEARKRFGLMYNNARILTRQSLAWIHPSEPILALDIARWASVLCSSSCAFLRDDVTFLEESRNPLMKPSELTWLQTCKQPPIAASLVISNFLKKSSALSAYERMTMEEQLTQFDIAVGACERLRRQSIPMAYTRHTSRFLLCFLTFLPFGLWAYTEWLTLPVMVMLAFLLCGIENIGIQIEQPMLVLPLENMALGSMNSVHALMDVMSEAASRAQVS